MSPDCETLVVCAAPVAGKTSFYARLLSVFERIVAVDGGAALCLEVGRIPDLIVGDFDSLHPNVRAECARLGVPERVFPADKDVSDLDLALAALAGDDISEVTITACWGGRLDHTLAAIGAAARSDEFAVNIADPGLNGWVLSERVRPHLELLGRGSTVSLIAVQCSARVSCSGVRYPLERELLSPLSTWGLSNVICEPVANVSVHEGRLVVLSPRVGDVPSATAPRL
ncbi:MAG: thiamine diphosphokinase [Clostridiales bacterium]|nr:thiamine diphosphokinase [Clostridiales bacterium]